MRIIHGRDYYDSGLAYGRDDAVVFVREKERFLQEEEIVGHENLRLDATRVLSFGIVGKKYSSLYRSDDRYTINGTEFSAGLAAVVFCGKVYHGVRVETDLDKSTSKVVYYWHKERFEQWAAQMGVMVTRGWWESKADLGVYFSVYPAPKVMLDWLITQRIVIAIRFPVNRAERLRHGFRWAINSNQLKDVQFFRVFETYTAFQEIAMWVGGVLASSGNPMVGISDVVRIEKHGFDKVTSFRNMK